MAKATATIRPFDAAEQDAVLRSRLSHSLAHRPLLGLRNRITPILKGIASGTSGSHPDDTASQLALSRVALLPDLQSYLLALNRTQLSTTQTSSHQLAQYEQQLQQIQQEERDCKERILGLKRDLEGVRRRRREKVEYGRVVEGVEAWFKSNGPAGNEIEDSLSTLLSHLASSFLYKSVPSLGPDASQEDKPPLSGDSGPSLHHTQGEESTVSPHTETLSLLHSKLETMLTLAREVREIVGWKPGTGGGGGVGAGQNTGHERDAEASASASGSRAASVQAGMNPAAKPFEPLAKGERAGSLKRDLAGLAAPPSSSSTLTEMASSDLEEGEEISSSTLTASGSVKRRRVGAGSQLSGAAHSSSSSLAADDDNDEEEGSIATGAADAVGEAASGGARGPSRPSRSTRGSAAGTQRPPASGPRRGGRSK
ncbi:unnamed protein product [Parajaminaea phylloscopi]